MRRYMRFLPIMLAALALAASGSNIVLRNASAQLSGKQTGKQTGGKQKGEPQLSAAAQQQITALLQEKYSRTAERKKISSPLIYAMRAARGQAMTSRGEVPMLNSAMSIAKAAMSTSKDGVAGRAEVFIKGDVSKQLLMTVEKLDGEVKYANAGMIRAILPLDSLDALANEPAVKHVSSALLMAKTNRQAPGSNVLNGRATPLGINGVRPNFNQRAMNVRAQLTAALAKARAGAKAKDPLSNLGGVDQL